MATLNDNQIKSLINQLLTESTGAAPDEVAVQNMVDNGIDPDVIGSVEQFTKTLINVITKNWFLDSAYRAKYNDPFFVDSAEYGALVQVITSELSEAEEASNWQNFVDGQTIGTYKVHLPKLNKKMFGKSVSWQCVITISGTQWNTACENGAGFRELVAYVLMMLDNSIVLHKENLNRTNRNALMAKDLNNTASKTKINLVEAYVQERGDATQDMTVAEFLASPKALLFATEKLRLYKGYIGEYSHNFNIDKHDTFTPDDRIVIQVLSQFDELLNTVALSDTYHNDIVSLPGFKSVSYWQAEGTGFAWDDVSKIDVAIDDETSVSQDNIVAFMCDKWAVAHTIVAERTAVKVFEPEDLTNYYKQFNDKYMNLTNLNSIVFYLEDYTA